MELSGLEDVNIINERLERLYGKHTVVDKANFRLVFSDEQFEKRSGLKNAYIDGTNIVLFQEDGIHEVPKYPWLDEQWMVERLIGNHFPDVMEGSYTYQPVYAFPKGLPAPPWRVVEFLIQNLFVVDGVAKQPQNQAEAEAADNARKKLEVEKARNMLDTVKD